MVEATHTKISVECKQEQLRRSKRHSREWDDMQTLRCKTEKVTC